MFVYGMLFPSPGKMIVKEVKEAYKKIEDRYPIVELAKVSTTRVLPGGVKHKLEVAFHPTGSRITGSGTIKLQSYNVFVFGQDESLVDELAVLTEATLRAIVGQGAIRNIQLELGVTDWEIEQGFGRWMTITASVAGITFNLEEPSAG